MKYVLIFCVIILATFASGKPNCPGCVVQVEEEDLKNSREVLDKSLDTLAAGDGPFYKIVKINSATRQVVSGRLDLINVDLKDQDDKIKTCNVEIWTQSWMKNGTRITFKCPGEKEVVKTHSALN